MLPGRVEQDALTGEPLRCVALPKGRCGVTLHYLTV